MTVVASVAAAEHDASPSSSSGVAGRAGAVERRAGADAAALFASAGRSTASRERGDEPVQADVRLELGRDVARRAARGFQRQQQPTG